MLTDDEFEKAIGTCEGSLDRLSEINRQVDELNRQAEERLDSHTFTLEYSAEWRRRQRLLADERELLLLKVDAAFLTLSNEGRSRDKPAG